MFRVAGRELLFSLCSCCIRMRSLIALSFLCFAVLSFSDASPYNKYGRSCKDIICTVREECVMERDECTAYSEKCGSFPTCKRKPGSAKGCASMKCPSGHFCSIRQEACSRPPCEIKPTCIAFRTPKPPSRDQSRPYSNQYSYNSQRNRNSRSPDGIFSR